MPHFVIGLHAPLQQYISTKLLTNRVELDGTALKQCMYAGINVSFVFAVTTNVQPFNGTRFHKTIF